MLDAAGSYRPSAMRRAVPMRNFERQGRAIGPDVAAIECGHDVDTQHYTAGMLYDPVA